MLGSFIKPQSSEKSDKSLKELQKELSVLQQKMKEKKLPVVILIDGWSASGKGKMISRLTAQLEPRSYSVFSGKAAVGDDARKPFLYRFWRDLPAKGNMAVFERGWYHDAFSGMSEHEDFDDFYSSSINTFERQLRDDGCVVLKFFLHISKEEQKTRMEELLESKATSWRIGDNDHEQNRKYAEFFTVKSRVLSLTNTEAAPWNIIWNEGEKKGAKELLSTICTEIEKALKGKSDTYKRETQKIKTIEMPKLSEVKLDSTLNDEDYERKLKRLKDKLSMLHSRLYREKVPVILAFEGWDAAGKGGAIRRLSWSLDPRGFEAVSIAAPTPDELAHHYLWRFWNKLPKDGHITIFDRTWYGRVMVERIEGFTPKERWEMAYDEINEFEKQLTDWGAIVLKFWIHIDKDTQLERFTERQNNPEKAYKITDEDFRNREKWDEYEIAVNEMIKKTSTAKAPWIIIEGNDKQHARIQVLNEVRKALEKKLT